MHNNNQETRPLIAVIDSNILAVTGLIKMLDEVMPVMRAVHFASLDTFVQSGPDRFVHYFVSVSIFIADRQFFMDKVRKTIVLTTSQEQAQQLKGIKTLCVNVPEQVFMRSLLQLRQMGHAHGEHMPAGNAMHKSLTAREVEVLVKVAEGHINKEIADMLHISITTVISHRKNITEKLGIKSVSGLTVYAVINGYVDISKIGSK